MKRAIAIADLHAHEWGGVRTEAPLDFLRHLADYCGGAGVSEIWVIGDFFHMPDGHSVPYLLRLLDLVAALPVTVRIVDGNHDHELGHDWTAIQLFQYLPNVHVYTETAIFPFGGQMVQVAPYYHTLGEMQRAIKPRRSKSGKRASILLCHYGLDGAYIGPMEAPYILPSEKSLPVESVLKHGYDLALFGHYHKPQKLDESVYIVGSPLQHRSDERGDKKRYMIVGVRQSGVEIESIPYHGPRYEDVTIHGEDDLNPDEDLTNCYVRAVLMTPTISRAQVHEAFDDRCLQVRIVPFREVSEEEGQAVRLSALLTDAQAVHEYVKRNYTKSLAKEEGINPKRLEKLMVRCLDEVKQ